MCTSLPAEACPFRVGAQATQKSPLAEVRTIIAERAPAVKGFLKFCPAAGAFPMMANF